MARCSQSFTQSPVRSAPCSRNPGLDKESFGFPRAPPPRLRNRMSGGGPGHRARNLLTRPAQTGPPICKHSVIVTSVAASAWYRR
jgi:hypothetical protein